MSVFHYMSLATPEAWGRLLRENASRTSALAWPAIAVSFAVSAGVFVLTLPERLLLWPVLRARFRRSEPTLEHAPGVVVVLGYYRSGTTHLHNLLSCDRRFVTPRWVQTLTPHGFWASWTVLRWALTPMLPNQRPQDGVAFGSWWPAEDDFAVNNWTLASSLPGRLVYPSRFGRYQRWQFLETCTDAERARWRRTLGSFCWKITRRHPGRRLLLKSPSHTSRVAELRRLFGDNVRFVVIERDREEVIASHLAMSRRLAGFRLEGAPDERAFGDVLREDLARCERALAEQTADLAPDRIARIAYPDLVVDPAAELRRAYEELGIEWSERFDRSISRYMAEVGDYRPAQRGAAREGGPANGALVESTGPSPARRTLGLVVALVSAAIGLAAWMWLADAHSARYDTMAWPLGFLIGLAGVRTAGRGDRWLGLGAGAAFVAAWLVAAYLLPEVTYGWVEEHRWKATRHAYKDPRAWVWVLFGLLTAYRCASRRHVRPPG